MYRGDHRRGGPANQQAFAARQNATHGDGAGLRDHLQRVNTISLVDRRMLAGTQPWYEATAGRSAKGHRTDAVNSNDSGARVMPLKMLDAAHQRAGGPGTDEQIVDMTEVLADRACRSPGVSTRVGRILVLIEPDVSRVAGELFPDQRNACSQKPAVGVRGLNLNHLGAIAAHHADVMAGAVGVDHAGKGYRPFSADHRQRHTEVARRRLDQNRVRAQQTPSLKVIDQPYGGFELDRASRVE